jgi:hypothetical protein
MDHLSRIYEGVMRYLFCKLMEDLWKINGGFMEDLWMIYG